MTEDDMKQARERIESGQYNFQIFPADKGCLFISIESGVGGCWYGQPLVEHNTYAKKWVWESVNMPLADQIFPPTPRQDGGTG